MFIDSLKDYATIVLSRVVRKGASSYLLGVAA